LRYHQNLAEGDRSDGMADKVVPRERRERGSISAEEILRGAFAVADRSDLDSLSMPELAKHLGVGVTSIYWYFRKKDDLLRSMSDEAVRTLQDRLPKPGDPAEWRDFLDRHFRAMRDTYRADDTMADLALVRIRSYSLEATHFTYQNVERIIEMLVEAGFTPGEAWKVYSMISTFTRGVIILERTQRMNNSPLIDERQSKLIVPTTMPRLANLIDEGSIRLSMVSEDNFDFGLRTMLDGFERLLSAHEAENSPSSL
jgi:AcrR family transcriptional regulator